MSVPWGTREHPVSRKTLLDSGPLLVSSSARQQVRWMKEEPPSIHGGECQIVNHTGKKIHFTMQLELHSDFADIFEVKSKRLVQRGRLYTEWERQKRRLRTSYDHKDFHCAVAYTIMNTEVPVGYANGRIFFEIELEPGQEWHSHVILTRP